MCRLLIHCPCWSGIWWHSPLDADENRTKYFRSAQRTWILCRDCSRSTTASHVESYVHPQYGPDYYPERWLCSYTRSVKIPNQVATSSRSPSCNSISLAVLRFKNFGATPHCCTWLQFQAPEIPANEECL